MVITVKNTVYVQRTGMETAHTAVHTLCGTVHCRGHKKLPTWRGVSEVSIKGNEMGRKLQKEITDATKSKHSSLKAKEENPGRF